MGAFASPWKKGGHRLAAAGTLAVALFSAGPAIASDLYSATVIVTGRDNLAERERGIREALPRVLTRLTADPDVARAAVADGLASDAAGLVDRLEYLDRKAGIQISDEQGTRERSFELTVHFDPAGIDAILSRLGARAWKGERPPVAVEVEIDNGVRRFLLTRQSEMGYGQRLAVDDESRSLGLPVRIPGDAGFAETAVTLSGQMVLEANGFWDTRWRLTGGGIEETFAGDDTTFDTAIADALHLTARALSKH